MMTKADLAQACWTALADNMPQDIHLDDLASACGMSADDAIIFGGDVTELILTQLDRLDCEALATSAADFADDPHATIYDKILEGLMMRFEALAPYRSQFNHLHKAAMRNPLLALHLTHQLSHTVGKLLHLAGDDSTGPIKQARILGVVGTLLRMRASWAEDESADLGLTMKALDDGLKKACEWALTMRVLSESDISGKGADQTGGSDV